MLVLKKLDRETISNYTLTAQIIDTKTGRMIDKYTEFTIKVYDINDHTPVFSEMHIGFVDERASKGTKLTYIINVLISKVFNSLTSHHGVRFYSSSYTGNELLL